MYIEIVINFFKRYSLVTLAMALLAGLPASGIAQSCTGTLGAPLYQNDFGQGTNLHGGAIGTVHTNYLYSTANVPPEGYYTTLNTTAGASDLWWPTTDHTGNAGGYMMIINGVVASNPLKYYYKESFYGLCPGSTFEFAVWVANLINTVDGSPPNLRITAFTGSGQLIASLSTGSIPVTINGIVWKRYALTFKTPPNVTDISIQIINNNPDSVQPGNNIALDDITLKACRPIVNSYFMVGNFQAATQFACAGANQTYTLKSDIVAGVYDSPAYQWQVNTASGWKNIAGENSTTYYLNSPPTVAGTYEYRMLSAEAANIGLISCQVPANVLTLTVSNSPTASFIIANYDANCLLKTVDFKDKSTPNGIPITSWKWDFGDGEIGINPSPTHTYALPGDYTVKLTVANNTGCASTYQQTVHVTSKLMADFDATVVICPNSPVTFTDKSTSVDPIVKWLWTFDDGTAELTLTSSAPFTHTFASTGDHKVSLEVISSTGCVSDIFSKIVSVTKVDFTICPGGVTQFTDVTVKPGTPGFNYSWDFGDGAATPANPNTSALQNPTHSYVKPGNYTVTLTVSAQNGCPPNVQQKTFTVTGVPIANFEIENKAGICGADSVTFVDKTDVNSNIKRLVWFYDVDNHPTDSVVITQAKMRSDRKYHYFYGVNTTATPQIYHALLIARIEGPCPDPTFKQDVVINPNPVAVLSVNGTTLVSPFVVCQDAGPIIIKTSANVPGKPTFTGEGITIDGVFDPKALGIGTFTINYLYTADNTECTYAITFKITVTPAPIITLAPSAGALEGQQTTLNPGVSGSNFKYSWSPVTGISDPAALNPFFSPAVDTKYTLTVTSAQGCSSSAQVLISVLKIPLVPNTFTPNNDGINDTWNIKYLDTYPTAVVEVFSRYGAKVFSSNNYTVPWDGKFNGVVLPLGVYYYIIDTKNGRKPMTGSLTIIK